MGRRGAAAVPPMAAHYVRSGPTGYLRIVYEPVARTLWQRVNWHQEHDDDVNIDVELSAQVTTELYCKGSSVTPLSRRRTDSLEHFDALAH